VADRERFRRRAFRRGYKVDEVDVFLDRVEDTLAGRPDGQPVTPQDVREVVFRVRFGGYDEWQVDVALDRLERQLVALEQSGVVSSLPEEDYDDAGYGRGGYAPVGRGPREFDRDESRRAAAEEPPGYDRYGAPAVNGSRGGPVGAPRSRSGNTHSGGIPVAARYADAEAAAEAEAPARRSEAGRTGGRSARTNPGMTVPPVPGAGFAAPVAGGAATSSARGRGAVYGAPPRTAPPPPPPSGRHGRSDAARPEVPPPPPAARQARSAFSSDDTARVAELRGTFSSRRFGSGYDPDQVDRLFDAVEATLEGRSAGAVRTSDLDPARLQLVPGGYFENEVEKAMREVRGLLADRLG